MVTEVFAYIFITAIMFLYGVLSLILGSFWALYARIVITSSEFQIVLLGTIFVLAPFIIVGFLLGFLSKSLARTEPRLRVRLGLGIFLGVFTLLSVFFLLRFVDQTNAFYDPTRVIQSSGMGWGTTTGQQFVAAWLSGLFLGLTVMFMIWLSHSLRLKVHSRQQRFS